MPVAETVLVALGASVAKYLIKGWLGDNLPNTLAAKSIPDPTPKIILKWHASERCQSAKAVGEGGASHRRSQINLTQLPASFFLHVLCGLRLSSLSVSVQLYFRSVNRLVWVKPFTPVSRYRYTPLATPCPRLLTPAH